MNTSPYIWHLCVFPNFIPTKMVKIAWWGWKNLLFGICLNIYGITCGILQDPCAPC